MPLYKLQKTLQGPSGLCIRKKRLLLSGLFRGWNQGVTVPTRYCDTLVEIKRGDSEKAAWVSQIWRSVVG
ncbi:hypothetical protein TNCV_1711711 [Trichonephila clavipes]|nr:hypothetical protein TNCV_1711711 [Trichonephila clavipes]